MISVLVQEIDKAERHMYFVIKVFKGAEMRYQKIEKLGLAIVITVRKLKPYFQGHNILVTTNYPIHQVFKKPDLAGRLISWSIEHLEYDIQYIQEGA